MALFTCEPRAKVTRSSPMSDSPSFPRLPSSKTPLVRGVLASVLVIGGCAVALVKAGSMDSIARKFTLDYKEKTGIDATLFHSRPVAGASIVKQGT